MFRKKLVVVVAAAACFALTSCSTISDALSDSNDKVDRDPEGQITQAGNVDAYAVKVGDCINSADLGMMVSEVPAIPCDEPHDSEAYLAFNVTMSSYDDDAISEEAETRCGQAFTEYVGPNAESYEPMLDYTALTPSASSWSQYHDREIVCLVYAETPTLVGSVKGVAP